MDEYGFTLHHSEVIKYINILLEDKWTHYEILNGKRIPVELMWRPSMKMILGKYRDAGWDVVRNVELVSDSPNKRDYLRFINPMWVESAKKKAAARRAR